MAAWHYSSASKKLMQGNLDEALADCERALEWMPKTPRCYQLRAEIHLQQGQLQAARRDCDKLLKLNSNFPQGYQKRSRIYLLLAAAASDEAAREKFYEKAIDDAETAKNWLGDKDASGPTKLDDILAVASGFNQLAYTRAVADKQLEEALADIQHAISMLDRDEQNEDGDDEEGDDEDDERKRDEELGRDLSYANFLDTRGFILFRQKQYEKALIDLNEAIQVFSRVKQISLKRISDRDADRKKSAEKRMNASLGVMHQHHGQIYEKLGKSKEAKSNFEKAAELGYDPKIHGQ